MVGLLLLDLLERVSLPNKAMIKITVTGAAHANFSINNFNKFYPSHFSIR